MLVVGKDETQIINFDNVTSAYVGGHNAIKINLKDGSGCQIAEYNTLEMAREALSTLAEAAARDARVFTFPGDEELHIRIQARAAKWHHATGKKTKGHGGS
jgi:hypothetical protein